MSTTACALIIENIIKQDTILSWLERKMSTTGFALIIQNLIRHDKMLSWPERKMSTTDCGLVYIEKVKKGLRERERCRQHEVR